ncbi:WYL domain-containing protein [Paenibacillus athensensis]|uniref:HTH deoR-type domain-containing protein n=1 Tax=Paenibacillus athensensis TaxID=1967502 RepID=A0A4Y8Q3L7_9BACL|nr:WYL domain-containing protein [Paenibacillus athensensis]MCD1258396.1 WYL domain-containing protein [Paenibacillus athensensis]
MKADRLLSLLLLLQNHGKMTTRELAARLEVTPRTVCRDMEALSAAGIPVYAERGPHGGWTMTEGYRTKLTGLRPQEVMALLLNKPSSLLRDLGIGPDFDLAYQKLVASSPAHLRHYAGELQNRLHIDGNAWFKALESYPFLATVQEAVWSCRKLWMKYPLPRGPYEGIVEPLGLVAKRNVWYFVAGLEGELAFFRVSRLEEAELLEDTFQRPDDFDLSAYWERASTAYVNGRLAYRLKARLREEAFSLLPPGQKARLHATVCELDGWLTSELEFRSYDAALAAMLSLGNRVEVLEPAELREGLRAAALSVAALYGTGEPADAHRGPANA